MRISIIDSAECSCRTILLIFRVFVRGVFLASTKRPGGSERDGQHRAPRFTSVLVRLVQACHLTSLVLVGSDGSGGGEAG